MELTSTILTVGTALRHAQSQEATVHVLVGGIWLRGSVIGLDGEGVALRADDGETTVVRLSGVTAVRVEPTEEVERPVAERPAYDGFGFPSTMPADLSTLAGEAISQPA